MDNPEIFRGKIDGKEMDAFEVNEMRKGSKSKIQPCISKILEELPEIGDEFEGERVIKVKSVKGKVRNIYKVITKDKQGKKGIILCCY